MPKLLAIVVLSFILSCNSPTKPVEAKADTVTAPTKSKFGINKVGVGSVLHTTNFDITISGYKSVSSKRPNSDHAYIVVSISYTNISQQNQQLPQGYIFTYVDKKPYIYEYDSEMYGNNYNFIYKAINPLITKKCKMSYKIPHSLRDNVWYWFPYLDNVEDLILLDKEGKL